MKPARFVPTVTALACAALAIAFAMRADAAEDGGTRSIFASGAGTRALGMGGAFVAVADDPSAILWNPAGLGRLQRLEVQAAHAEYGTLGSSEDYASFAFPDWRWGAVGVSILRFGVDGIESRDDRNLLLGDDLSNSEVEIALGLGRSVSEALGVGGTIKLQRQSLAGFSGSGFGADVGVLVRPSAMLRSHPAWADRVTLGFSIRNALQPSIRLDQESVRDPAVARTGVAYELSLGPGRRALAALDVEKTSGVALRTHVGLEVGLHPLLRLRGGLNGGSLSAGTAVTWRDFTVDYAFEDGDVSGIHRVGISRAIGQTVSQRRESATQAREKAIQARLDETFQRRQVEQTESLLSQVRAAEARADFEEALKLLATIAVLYPGRPDAAALELLSLRGQGRQLESRGDYPAAAAVYGRLLSLAPGDTAAVAGQLRCREETERRAAHAEQAISRRAADALAAASRARQAEADSAARARARAAPVKRVLSKEQQREVADLYRRGAAAMSERRSDDALRYWELVWSMDPGYERVAEYLKREYLMRGMEHFASGRLDEAIAYWERVLQVDPGDERAAGYASRARTQLARAREIIGGNR